MTVDELIEQLQKVPPGMRGLQVRAEDGSQSRCHLKVARWTIEQTTEEQQDAYVLLQTVPLADDY